MQRDYGFVGCGKEVLGISDRMCSGRRNCTIDVPNAKMDEMTTCPVDFKSYLNVSYRCVDGKDVIKMPNFC